MKGEHTNGKDKVIANENMYCLVHKNEGEFIIINKTAN